MYSVIIFAKQIGVDWLTSFALHRGYIIKTMLDI